MGQIRAQSRHLAPIGIKAKWLTNPYKRAAFRLLSWWRYRLRHGHAHSLAIKMDRRFELVAGCFGRPQDINSASAGRLWRFRDRTYSVFKRCLRPKPDGSTLSVVLTPQHQHYAQVIDCLKAACPCHLRKGIGEFERRCTHHQSYSRCAPGLSGGRGKLIPASACCVSCVLSRPRRHARDNHSDSTWRRRRRGFSRLNKDSQPFVPQDWRLEDQLVPTVSLDLGVHLHGIINFITGERPEVVALQKQRWQLQPGRRQCRLPGAIFEQHRSQLGTGKPPSVIAMANASGYSARPVSAEWVQEYPDISTSPTYKARRSKLDRADAQVSVANQPAIYPLQGRTSGRIYRGVCQLLRRCCGCAPGGFPIEADVQPIRSSGN